MKLAIAGASGKMGRMLIEAVLARPSDFELAVALEHSQSNVLGQDAGAFLGIDTGVKITADLNALAQAECLIDFTRPEGTLEHLKACVNHQTKLVIGTTGFDAAGKTAIQQASESIAVVFAPNMGIGVNATFKLLEVAAKILNSGYDVEVFEAHHKHKVDAPSGTAIKMGEIVAQAWGKSLDDVATWTRHGHTGAREEGSIGFSVVRGGDIVGDHTVYFCGPGERIEITHRSSSRESYAQGSVRAALFIADKPKGLFDMQTILGL